jgi:cathepsin L
MRCVGTLFAATLALLAISTFARTPGHKVSLDFTFERYSKEHRKSYVRGTAEYEQREQNFKAALAEVVRHNSNPRRSFTKGLNHLSDWSSEEVARLRGARHDPTYKSKYEVPFVSSGVKPLESVDWRQAQPPVLTAIKDQGSCGDCWAHSVTEGIESAYARATGNLLVLSQQQVTSCTPMNQSCYGCGGSWTSLGFDYVAGGGANASFGLVEEWVYPFLSWEGGTPACNATLTKPWANGLKSSVQITNWTRVSPNNVTAIMEALSTLGPMSILVDASTWNGYESGIFTECPGYEPFGNFGLDHAVQLVGYGYDGVYDMQYWIVRNSWSAGWGENGYIRIARNDTAECGLTTAMSCSMTRGNMTACGQCGVLVDVIFPMVNVTKRTLK